MGGILTAGATIVDMLWPLVQQGTLAIRKPPA